MAMETTDMTCCKTAETDHRQNEVPAEELRVSGPSASAGPGGDAPVAAECCCAPGDAAVVQAKSAIAEDGVAKSCCGGKG